MSTGNRWTEAELRACVSAYATLMRQQAKGANPVKAVMLETLLKGELRNRTKGSIEYRMGNISSVMHLAGKQFAVGYVPANNVGTHSAKRIRDMLVDEGLI